MMSPVHAANDGAEGVVVVLEKLLRHTKDLQGQLARRRNHQHARTCDMTHYVTLGSVQPRYRCGA